MLPIKDIHLGVLLICLFVSTDGLNDVTLTVVEQHVVVGRTMSLKCEWDAMYSPTWVFWRYEGDIMYTYYPTDPGSSTPSGEYSERDISHTVHSERSLSVILQLVTMTDMGSYTCNIREIGGGANEESSPEIIFVLNDCILLNELTIAKSAVTHGIADCVLCGCDLKPEFHWSYGDIGGTHAHDNPSCLTLEGATEECCVSTLTTEDSSNEWGESSRVTCSASQPWGVSTEAEMTLGNCATEKPIISDGRLVSATNIAECIMCACALTPIFHWSYGDTGVHDDNNPVCQEEANCCTSVLPIAVASNGLDESLKVSCSVSQPWGSSAPTVQSYDGCDFESDTTLSRLNEGDKRMSCEISIGCALITPMFKWTVNRMLVFTDYTPQCDACGTGTSDLCCTSFLTTKHITENDENPWVQCSCALPWLTNDVEAGMFLIHDLEVHSTGLSVGDIIGIVFGSIAGAVVIVLVIVCIYKQMVKPV